MVRSVMDSVAVQKRRQNKKQAGAEALAAAVGPLVETLESRQLLSAGHLDPGFGKNGIVVNPDPNGTIHQVLLQSTGKLVAAESEGGAGGTSSLALERFNANGSLDTTFGQGGKVETGLDVSSASGRAFLLRSDTLLVVVGTKVERFSADGALDTTYGNGTGSITLPAYTGFAVAAQPDGKILVTSNGTNGTPGNGFQPTPATITRYNPDGSVDGSFGSGGTVSYMSGGAADPTALSVTPSGDILLTVHTFTTGITNYSTVARLNSSGVYSSVPYSIGAYGSAFAYSEFANFPAAAISPDGTVDVAGSVNGGGVQLAINRYAPDGTVLPTDVRGYGVGSGAFSSETIASGGKLVVAGSVNNGATSSGYLVRLNPDGTFDKTFANQGTTLALDPRLPAGFDSVVVTPDGRVIASGGNELVGFTNDAAATPGTVPNRPFNLTATAYSDTVTTISFYDNSDNETGFTVERATSPNGPYSIITGGRVGAHAGTGLVSVGDSGLIPGTTYYYRVKAIYFTNDTAYEGPVVVTTTGTSNLISPTNLVASTRAGGANNSTPFVDFSFTDPGGYSQFVVFTSVNNGPPTSTALLAAGAGKPVAFSLSAMSLQQYTFSVYGLTASGQQGPTAGPVTTSTGYGGGQTTNPGGPPNGPYALTAAAPTSTSVNLSFVDNADNETGFVIERSTSQNGPFAQVTTLAPSAPTRATISYTDATAAAGTTYYYRVYAVNGPYQSYIAGPSQVTTPGTGAALALPTDLTASLHSIPIGDPRGPVYFADVKFTDPGGYANFAIQQTVDGVTSDLGTVPAAGAGNTVTRPNIPVSNVASTIVYTVYGITADGKSGPSAQHSLFGANPGGAPNGPYNLQASAINATLVGASFVDNADNETGFILERSTAPDGPFTVAGVSGPNAGVGGTVTMLDGNAVAGTSYYYRVYAVNGTQQSYIAGPMPVTTPGGGAGGTTNPGGAPNGPFSLTAAAFGAHSARVQFVDNSDNETGFILERSTSPSGGWAQVATLTPSAGVHQTVSYTDTPPAAGTYYYRAYAVNGPYQSSIVGPAQVTTA